MKKKRNIKLKLTEIVFIFFCIAGAGFSIWMFWNEINHALCKLNEVPIATVTFKYNTAQRKFLDRMLWDRLRRNSPVYEGDTIHTAPQSEATVCFSDGNVVELYENTLVRLSMQENSPSVDFDFGNMNVHACDGGIKVRAGASVLRLDDETSVSAEGTDKIRVQVQKGMAFIENAMKGYSLEAGKTVVFDADGGILEPVILSVISPKKEEKFINYSREEDFPVVFEWETDASDVALDVSRHKDFRMKKTYYFSGIQKTEVKMPAGVCYWRMYPCTPEMSEVQGASESVHDRDDACRSGTASGRVRILYVPVPAPIAPADGYTVRYRSRKPAVRFIWTESNRTTSYELEIADNPQMNNPLIKQRSPITSCIISSLEEGRYWWRVTPYYTVNNIGSAASSAVSYFSVIKSSQLSAPEILHPVQEGLIHTKVSAADLSKTADPAEKSSGAFRSVHFSWKDNPEAASYTVKIGKDPLLENPVIAETVSENHYILNPAVTFLENGQWFWQVTVSDFEGNTASSPVCQFFAIDTDIEQRTLFPPDGYRLADSRSQDIRYVWKTNIPSATVFQLASDPSFDNCIVSQSVSATSMNGRSLVPGEYYWRISAETEGKNLNTPAKKLIVEPPLDRPQGLSPLPGGCAVIRASTIYEFKWHAVDGADYYHMKIYAADNSGKLVYEKNFIEGDASSVDMEPFADGNYCWSVQAFREESPLASRATGYLGLYNFAIRKLRPIALLAPSKEEIIDGISAIKSPCWIEWNAVELPAESQLVLYKESVADENIVLKADNPLQKLKLPRLHEGLYFWTVTGSTADGLDISAGEMRNFTVTAVPKLPAPAAVSPSHKEIFRPAYFRNNRQITFSWKPEKYADEYILRIYKAENIISWNPETGDAVFEKTLPCSMNQFILTDLSLLARGAFVWSVEARSHFEGALFQEGEKRFSEFKIDLPKLKGFSVYNTGVLYGK